jgi:hypothetical protein
MPGLPPVQLRLVALRTAGQGVFDSVSTCMLWKAVQGFKFQKYFIINGFAFP